MVLPFITGKKCFFFSDLNSQRQFSDFQFPPIDDVSSNKLNRVWSNVCSGLLKTESKIKQCASFLCKNTTENKEIVDFHLPSIFQGNAKNILNEERSLKEMVASKQNINPMELSNKDLIDLLPRRQSIMNSSKNMKEVRKQQAHISRNYFSTIAVSWCGRNSRTCYTRRELTDIFTAFGPVKNVRFLSPRFAEIEFVWLGSACLAVRAPNVRLPGKVALYRQWADTSMKRQLWCKKDSHAK